MSKKNTESEGVISRVAKAIAGPKRCMVKLGDLYLTEGGQGGHHYEGEVFECEADAKKAFAAYASKSITWSGEPEYLVVE